MRQMFGPGPPFEGELNLIKQQDNFLGGNGQPTRWSSLQQTGWERGGLLPSSPAPSGDPRAGVCDTWSPWRLWFMVDFRKDQPLILAARRLTIFSLGLEDFLSGSMKWSPSLIRQHPRSSLQTAEGKSSTKIPPLAESQYNMWRGRVPSPDPSSFPRFTLKHQLSSCLAWLLYKTKDMGVPQGWLFLRFCQRIYTKLGCEFG